jgi:menaquinone-dependent protoporphyrinogen oxidase
MTRTLVLYASRHGQAKKIAEYVGDVLRAHGAAAEVLDVATLPRGFGLNKVAGCVLVASVHTGLHPRDMALFVARNREALQRMPTGFLSVSLSQADVENTARSDEERLTASRDVTTLLERFFTATDFRPQYVKPVAGALSYTRYNPFVRFLMRGVAREAGVSTDTSRNHEFTSWEAVTDFARTFATELPGQNGRQAPRLAS